MRISIRKIIFKNASQNGKLPLPWLRIHNEGLGRGPAKGNSLEQRETAPCCGIRTGIPFDN